MRKLLGIFLLVFLILPVHALAEIDMHLAMLRPQEHPESAEFDLYARKVVSLASTCDNGCNNANITFWINEDDTLGSTGCSDPDYSTAGNIDTQSCTWNTDAGLVGTNGMDCDAENERGYITDANLSNDEFDDLTFRALMVVRFGSVVDGDTFWRLYYDATSEIRVRMNGTDDITLTYKDPTNGEQTCSSTDDSIGAGIHVIEIKVDRVTDGLQLWIDNDSKCTDTGTYADWSTNGDYWRFGSVAGVDDIHIDQLIVSTDEDTSLWEYRDDTAYNSCN